jgi:hypothetical protein
MVGDVCGFNLFGCLLGHFKNCSFVQGFCYLSVSDFFCPSFWRVSMAFEVH